MRNLIFSVLVSAPLITPLFFPLAAEAGCGFLDITCNPAEWTCPIGGCGGNGDEGGGAETQVITPATFYEFEIRNATRTAIYFAVNNTQYSLQPGTRQNFRIRRSSGSSSGGSSGDHYNATISWDGDYPEGYQARSFTLPISGYDSWYEFRSDDNRTIYLY
jgi:hypothetical protein